jgi:hypothetical protein
MAAARAVRTLGGVRRLVLAVVAMLMLAVGATAATNPVVTAVERSAHVRSSTLRMSVTTAGGGTRQTLTGTGAQSGDSVSLSMRTRVAGQSVKMDAVLLRQGGSYVMFMRSPMFASQLPAAKKWLKIDLSQQAAANAGVDFSSLIDTEQTLAPLEKGLVSTKRLGRETVAGKATTHYQAVVDLQRAARAIPAYAEQIAAVQKATGLKLGRTTQHVWVGGDGRVRQIRSTTPTVVQGGVRGTATQTITFLAYDVPVRITAPPAAQVATP